MKLICVTWGVLSGIWKWITGASIGALLKAAGYKVFMQKFDGYLNVDPGTMNPTQHGEVFVMNDGSETDLDLWHYERFMDTDLNGSSSRTTGKIFEEILAAERNGDYLWETVQIIPHVTNAVKQKIREAFDQSWADISIVEIWGTVGDMENEYLLESVRQLRQELGSDNVVFVHLTYIPYLAASKELKTKPTQMSVKDFRMKWLYPDLLVVRADTAIEESLLQKISYLCGVAADCVIPAPTVDSIYQIPLDYHARQVWHLILNQLQLPHADFELDKRALLNTNIKNSVQETHIALVGKYVGLEDAYYSLNEALKVAWFYNTTKVRLHFVDAESLSLQESLKESLGKYDGICVPWWFGKRGIEGMILACQYAREQRIPYLGICLGSQIMAIEFARHVLWYQDADSEEFTPNNLHNVIHMMQQQRSINKKWWTMRLGAYPCLLQTWTHIHKIYHSYVSPQQRAGEYSSASQSNSAWEQPLLISERHRHRYEFNNLYREEFEKNWFIISGTSPDGELVEMVEIKDHPFMVATQAHPELISRPTRPHPLFMEFVKAAKSVL